MLFWITVGWSNGPWERGQITLETGCQSIAAIQVNMRAFGKRKEAGVKSHFVKPHMRHPLLQLGTSKEWNPEHLFEVVRLLDTRCVMEKLFWEENELF